MSIIFLKELHTKTEEVLFFWNKIGHLVENDTPYWGGSKKLYRTKNYHFPHINIFKTHYGQPNRGIDQQTYWRTEIKKYTAAFTVKNRRKPYLPGANLSSLQVDRFLY